MGSRFFCKSAVILLLACAPMAVLFAQQQPNATGMLPNPYGAPIPLDVAKKAVAPAIAVAQKNKLKMAIAVVDPAGNLVYFEKMDDTELASSTIAIEKARSSALFKRPTRAFQDLVSAGEDGVRFLALQGAIPIEGGFPLIVDGKIIGAIGASGGTSAQDAMCAKAGADSLK